MTSFPPISPRLLKGAIIGTDPANPLASVVLFQYNPETLTRRVDARATGGNEYSDRAEAFRLMGPPRETISLSIEVDYSDPVVADPVAPTTGVYPPLAALEMLLYPKSETVVKNAGLARAGNIEIIPPEAPMTLFVWGPARVLPVRITGLSITEEFYDQQLTPIRARAELSMYVLSYADLKIDHPGYTLFLTHQIAKEVLATSNTANSALNAGASLNIG